jgi:hypothetical protein
VAKTEHETNQTEPRAQASGHNQQPNPSKRKIPQAIRQNKITRQPTTAGDCYPDLAAQQGFAQAALTRSK